MRKTGETQRLWRTYLSYRSLLSAGAGASLSGKYVLLSSSGAYAQARAAAARIAGAATLLLLEDERDAKETVREGACDFLVTSLDEALRILKNEVRRGAPVAVCLRTRPDAVVSEMVERGVQPDLLDRSQEALVGASVVAWEVALSPGEFAVEWSADSVRELEALDELAGASLDRDDPERRRWLRQAPPVLGRALARRRCLPMRMGECSPFVERISQSHHADNVNVERDGVAVWPASEV